MHRQCGCDPNRTALDARYLLPTSLGRGVKATLTYTGSGSGWRLAVTRWRAGNARQAQAQAQLMAAFIPPPCECDELHPPTPTDDGVMVVDHRWSSHQPPYGTVFNSSHMFHTRIRSPGRAGPGGQEHARVLFLGWLDSATAQLHRPVILRRSLSAARPPCGCCASGRATGPHLSPPGSATGFPSRPGQPLLMWWCRRRVSLRDDTARVHCKETDGKWRQSVVHHLRLDTY